MTNKIIWAYEKAEQDVEYFEEKLNTMWVILCTLMVLISQVGYMMKESGTINMVNNDVVLLKTFLVVGVSSLTFFVFGFGFS